MNNLPQIDPKRELYFPTRTPGVEPIVEEGCAELADNQETERRIANPETLSMSQSAPDATLLIRQRRSQGRSAEVWRTKPLCWGEQSFSP